jgi:hypothetical protein
MKLFERRAGEVLWCPERLPPTFGVRVMLVNSFYQGTGRFKRKEAYAGNL